MKSVPKLLGGMRITAIIVLFAIIGFSFTACDDDKGDDAFIEMVKIPAGTFIMGSPDTEPAKHVNETQHSVTLNGFSMGKYEVTLAQWVAVMGEKFGSTEIKLDGIRDNHPIRVNWYRAIAFCNKLSIMEGLNPVYSIGGSTNPEDYGLPPANYIDTKWDAAVMDKSKNGYRLPTEAEWEYACRGSYANKATAKNTKPFGIGDGINMMSGMANFYAVHSYDWKGPITIYGSPFTFESTEVGSYEANNYGLYDMHGNVWEWCWDWYKHDITADNNNPVGAATGIQRVTRGGDCMSDGCDLRSARRYGFSPEDYHGFRLVRS